MTAPPLEPDKLARLDAHQRERYDRRLDQFGHDPRTLGWGDAAQQRARFNMVVQAASPAGKEVLDVGCGFGDFLTHLQDLGTPPSRYLGWDINPRLLEVARRLHPEDRFETRNMLTDPPLEPIADLVVAIGVFNLRPTEVSPESIVLGFLDTALAAARETVVLNGISAARDPAYPEETVIAYRDPHWLLRVALERTPHVDLLHSFRSIPQREFVLVLRKEPRP